MQCQGNFNNLRSCWCCLVWFYWHLYRGACHWLWFLTITVLWRLWHFFNHSITSVINPWILRIIVEWLCMVHIYLFWTFWFWTEFIMPGLYKYWQIITFFQSSLGKKEMHVRAMKLLNSHIINFSELLWNPSFILMCYKLYRFPPSTKSNSYQFDIFALLIWGLRQFLLIKWTIFMLIEKS